MILIKILSFFWFCLMIFFNIIKASLTSFVILSAAVGEILLPLLVGSLFEKEGPISFIVIELVTTLLALIIFLKFWHYCRQHAKYFGNSILNFE